MILLQKVNENMQLYTAPGARLVISVLLAASEAALDFGCERQACACVNDVHMKPVTAAAVSTAKYGN